ncbi:hypothetical protein ABMA79_13735 [Halobacteriovorax sp. HFRX-2_2]|uniref:hypothetical protein n=1 Tax=unclassified Halobacteriovorax TaxID=2639665 RepID=UPI00371BF96B
MTKFFSFFLISIALISCASGKKAREFEIDYKILNASNKIEPDWLESADNYKGDKDYHYFLSQSENRNRRLCVKSATARSTAVIASEISQEIANDYTEVTNLDEDSQEIKTFSETLTQSIRTKVSGVRVKEQYWEKRQKMKDEKLIGDPYYTCYSLVGIKEDTLQRAIRYAQEKAIAVAKDSHKEELRQKFED